METEKNIRRDFYFKTDDSRHFIMKSIQKMKTGKLLFKVFHISDAILKEYLSFSLNDAFVHSHFSEMFLD